MKQLFCFKRKQGDFDILNNALVLADTENEARELVVAEHTRPADKVWGFKWRVMFDAEDFLNPELVTCEIVDLNKSKYLLGEVSS